MLSERLFPVNIDRQTRTTEVPPIRPGTSAPSAFAMARYSVNARTPATAARRKVAWAGRNQIVPMTTGNRTSAESTRVRLLSPAFCLLPSAFASSPRHRRLLDPSVPPIALLVGDYGLEQMGHAEVGPQRVGDPDLRVGDLPQQEVADAHLAARADQQVRIGLAAGVEVRRKARFIDLIRSESVADDPFRRFDDLGAAAVVQRDVEEHARVGRRLRLGVAPVSYTHL